MLTVTHHACGVCDVDVTCRNKGHYIIGVSQSIVAAIIICIVTAPGAGAVLLYVENQQLS